MVSGPTKCNLHINWQCERNLLAIEVLTKGQILDWRSDGKLYERFLKQKLKASVLCKGLKMTKVDPEFTWLCIVILKTSKKLLRMNCIHFNKE